MESEEFKVMLVVTLMLAALFSTVASLHHAYYNGYYEGKVSILQPKEAK